MKRLVNLRNLVAIGKKDYFDTSIWNHIKYLEAEENQVEEYELNSWEEAYSAIKRNEVRNAAINTTLFGKPCIVISWGSFDKRNTVLTERNFKPIKVRWEWVAVKKSYSIKDLANLLPAEQFCEWLKDNGINKYSDF